MIPQGFGKFMSLRVKKTESGFTRLVLDGRELIGVKRYEIKSSTFKGKAELLIELTVNFPPDSQEQENGYVSEQGKMSDDALQSGKTTINEVREKMGLFPIDNGDEHFTKDEASGRGRYRGEEDAEKNL